MKPIYIIGLLVIISFSSCKDFLEEVSQDQVVPTTVTEYKELLFGEAYPTKNNSSYHFGSHDWLFLMTDDAVAFRKSFGMQDKIEQGWGYYTYQKDPEIRYTGVVLQDNAWESYYHSILIANIVINTIDDINGTELEKKDLLGEAYFIRSFSYFMLVNLYGEPFEKGQAENKLGVPINLNHTVQDINFSRESVAKVYELINSDIEKSIELFEEAKIDKSFFRIGHVAAKAFASRVYLYQEEYQKVINIATDALTYKSTLYDLNNYSPNYFINPLNPEILFTYGRINDENGFMNTSLVRGGFTISTDLLLLYESGDKRKPLFYQGMFTKSVLKSSANETGVFGKAIRVAELYLNRAEAELMLHHPGNAKEDLNELRKNRIDKDYEITTDDEVVLLKALKDERRRELAFEDHRWFDLRRYGMPRIEHRLKETAGGSEVLYVLEEKDPAYTLPIPINVIKNEPNIVNIKRPVRNFVK